MANKLYNALTGAELFIVIPLEVDRALIRIGMPLEQREAILKEIRKSLQDAGIDSMAITYPNVSWSWSLTILQKDSEGHPAAETPEQVIEAGHPEEIAQAKSEAPDDSPSKLLRSLEGGSKRFRRNPPAPTEVREAEGMPIPEA